MYIQYKEVKPVKVSKISESNHMNQNRVGCLTEEQRNVLLSAMNGSDLLITGGAGTGGLRTGVHRLHTVSCQLCTWRTEHLGVQHLHSFPISGWRDAPRHGVGMALGQNGLSGLLLLCNGVLPGDICSDSTGEDS